MEMKDKREQILDTAEELFAEFGYEGTTVRDLAAKANVNVAMISYYFGSKEKLMETLIEDRSGYMRSRLVSLNESDMDPFQRIEVLIEYYVERLFTMNRFHRILYREISLQQRSQFNEVISKLMMRNFNEMRKLMEDGIKKKAFRKIDIELTIATLIGTISQVVLSSFMTCQMLKLDPETNSIFDKKHKERVKSHLKEMMRSHLLILQHA
ncbi:TetR family transcriptional regulator [soil metagenome]